MDFRWFWCLSVGLSALKKKSTILFSDVDNEGDYANFREGSVWEIYVPSLNFVVNLELFE